MASEDTIPSGSTSPEGSPPPDLGSISSSASGSPAASPLPMSFGEEHVCPICGEKYKQPIVLDCLHVFCTECVEKLVEGDDENHNTEDTTVTDGSKKSSAAGKVTCPECKQDTSVDSTGVASLPQDHVMGNMMDMTAIEEMQIICTSCKAKEKAVARCSDCANFLCPNCVTAHQYMRCFENHKVLVFMILS